MRSRSSRNASGANDEKRRRTAITRGYGVSIAGSDLEERCINTIRVLAIDAVEQAKAGHPGAPMGAAPMAYVLWNQFLKHNPLNPDWADRDRFVLSAGHASMLLYSLLHLTGYDLPIDELVAFRQWGSATPGHPEAGHTPGVEVTTGPLGAGFSMAVGMAIAEAWLSARFNQPGHAVVDHYTYGICSDGDLMEGVASEAASLAGTLRLGKLIFLYDDNKVTIDGATDLTFTEDVGKRFDSYGWQVLRADGQDTRELAAVIASAQADASRPTLVIVRTRIGEGSPNKVGKSSAHGSPLGPEEAALTRAALGWGDRPPFYVPGDVHEALDARATGQATEAEWGARFAAYSAAFPELAAEWQRTHSGALPEGWQSLLPRFDIGAQVETRVASGQAINALATVAPNLVGGSADLAGSNNTIINGGGTFGVDDRNGRNFYYGVREHAMGGIMNGMARHGGLMPFGGTFLTFSDYMRPAIRLASLMQARVVYIFTHDSIGLGEDGPTHQPIEHLAALRAMPGLAVFRPADANETSAAWAAAIGGNGPAALALTRQKVPVLATPEQAMEGVAHGAYVLTESDGQPEVILIATGSEVSIAVEAKAALEAQGRRVRVVSLPCWELFSVQTESYRESVLPRAVRARVSIEAGASLGWERWTGTDGVVVGIDRFGASAPYQTLYREYGVTPERVVEAAHESLTRSGKE